MTTLRPPAFAGTFYPADEEELKKLVKKYVSNVPKINLTGKVKALISPHAGYIYSGPIASYGYSLLSKQSFKNVILLGPSHQMTFQNIALNNFSFWRTPLDIIPLSPVSKELQTESFFQLLNEVHAFEHSIEVQLPFLQTVLDKFEVTPLATGRIMNHKEIAKTLIKHIDETTLIIASSDLSHYLPYKKAQTEDKKTTEMILELNSNISHEQACGADGINILIEIAKQLKWKPKLLDYRNSGDTAGDKTKVVGYTSIIFTK